MLTRMSIDKAIKYLFITFLVIRIANIKEFISKPIAAPVFYTLGGLILLLCIARIFVKAPVHHS